MRNGPLWVVFVAALIVWACAWLVRSRQRIELLNFIDPERVADRAGLARLAGNILYLIGGLLAAGGVADGLDLVPASLIAPILIGTILLLTAWLYLGAQDYMKP